MKQILNFAIIIIFFTLKTFAQSGTLDSSFAVYGKTSNSALITKTATIQEDGKIVLAGNGTNGFAVVRYLSDGNLDYSFGSEGLTIVDFPAYIFETATGIGELQNGSLIVTGYGSPVPNIYNTNILIARLLPNGQLDSSFGKNGLTVGDFGFPESISTMQVQEDGKIVVTGVTVLNNQQGTQRVITARFLSSGAIDASFGDSGKVLSTEGPNRARGSSLLIQNDKKIVVGIGGGAAPYTFYMIRYDENGVLDKNFGVNGVVQTDLTNSKNENLRSLALQKDGKIIAAGEGNFSNFLIDQQMLVIRYNSNGTIDEAFGDKGATFIKFPKNYAEAWSVDLQSNGKIILAGRNYNDEIQDGISDFAQARLMQNGSVDSTFGLNGLQVTDFGGYDVCSVVLLQKDGKIISAGNGDIIGATVLARYLGDPTKPRPTIAQIKRWIRNHILHFEDANTNAAYYVIEKTTASNTGFVPVTKITANASTNNYSYTLPEAVTQSTYRIKAVNKDNSITYSSPISSSDPAIAGVASFKIYPNPAKERITVETSGTVQLRLQNSNGRVLLTQMVNGKGSIDINKLPNGIYYVVNTVNGESLKVVKE